MPGLPRQKRPQICREESVEEPDAVCEHAADVVAVGKPARHQLLGGFAVAVQDFNGQGHI